MVDRAIHLKRKPGAVVEADDFAVRPLTLPDLGDGQVLVRNEWLSVDPFMLLVLAGGGRFEALPAGEIMAPGGAVGVVAESRNPGWRVGANVANATIGWRGAYITDGSDLEPVLEGARPSWHLSVLGLTGMTAYVGVELVLIPRRGETMFISAAAGAVGSLAVQLAKQRGCRVIGSTGSDEKAAWLLDLGADHAFNYRKVDVAEALKELCPRGLDAYLDNVGGATLEAAIAALRVSGRVGVCGAVSRYGQANYRAGPSNFAAITEKALIVSGVSALAALSRASEIKADMLRRLLDGNLVQEETIVSGIENAPQALVSMLKGKNKGKMVVQI